MWNRKKTTLFYRHYLRKRSTSNTGFWVISVYFNLRNILPKSGTYPRDTLYMCFRKTRYPQNEQQSVTKVKSCYALLPMVLMYIRYYLKSVLRYKFLILDTCHPETLYMCPRRNVPDFGRVFLMLKYTDITQNTYVQS